MRSGVFSPNGVERSRKRKIPRHPRYHHPMTLRTGLVALSLLASLAAPLGAQGRDYIQSHYTKYEYEIPMRDGVKLFTAVYVPKDASRTFPIMLERTPYSVAPYGTDAYAEQLGPSEAFAREGFIFAYQDVRGRFMSEGTF